MSSLVQSGSVRYYMGWYGNCANDPQSPTGGCEPFDLVSEPRIRLVWEISDGIKAFSSASPSFSPIQQLEAGKCYMIAINPGDGVIDLPHLVLSGEGGYVGQSCALALNFVTVNAYTRPNTTEVDDGYGYYPVQYAPGETVTLTAKTRENYEFKEWSFFSPSSIWAEISDATSSTITFTMPSEPVTVSAEYIDLTLDSDGDGIPDHLDPYPNQSPQAINWADTDLTLLVVGNTAELKATAQTDITYTISDTSVATISGSTITIVGDGTAEVTATAPANSQYFGATATISFQTDADSDGDGIPDSQDTEPYQQAQSIVWNDDLSDLNVGGTFTLTASAQTAVTYASSDTSIATVSGNTLTLVAEGSVTITATAEPSSDYFTATSAVNAYITQVVYEEPLTLSVNDDGKLEVSFTYPEFTSYDPDTRCYKILLTFFEDNYDLRRMAWRPDAIGVHPENQRITFVVEDRPEFLSAADQVNGKVNKEPFNIHLDSFTVYHTANHATGSDIYGNASFYYTWSDYIRSTRVRAELKIDNYETFHSTSWFDYSSGTEPPSAEIDLPDTNGNGIWDSLDWDDEFQYSLSGDIITGSFRYSDKIFLNHGRDPSNYPDGYPAISLRWTDDFNGSSDASQPAWDGSLASSYSEGELVNFTFNANSIYGGTIDHINYRYPIHTDADKTKPIQFSLDFMYPSSYTTNMVRSSGPIVADYNWDADGDSDFDALDVYTAERVGSNIRVTFPYREGVFGVTINQDYAVELWLRNEDRSWVAWGVDWWFQGSNIYSDGEIVTIEQPLPAGYEQYINNEILVEWAAGTGGGTSHGQHIMVRKTIPEVVLTAPILDGWTMVVDSPARVEMPSDGTVPTVDVNGNPLFLWHPNESDPGRFGFNLRSSGGLDLKNYSADSVRFEKYGTVNLIYTDSSGNTWDTPLHTIGTFRSGLLAVGPPAALANSITLLDFNDSADVAQIHGLYGYFALYTLD